MEKILVLDKKLGETPLECLERFRAEHSEYKNSSMTYAGRLDPAAEGVLLVLAGDEVHEKEKYLKLEKIYEFEIVLGLETDTHDLLGLIERTSPEKSLNVSREGILKAFETFTGSFTQSYPAYASKTVGGKQLHEWAREGKIGDIEMPSHEVMIRELEVLEVKEILGREIMERAIMVAGLVKGDFRQAEIVKGWEAWGRKFGEAKFPAVTGRAIVSGGTYIRQLAHDVGRELGADGCLFSLVRMSVGDFDFKKLQK